MTQLESYISALLNLAQVQGVTSTNPILYKVVTGSDKMIVVSFTEPAGLTLPLNVLWLVADSSSSNYSKILRRTSKTYSGTYANTWTETTDYSDVITTTQYYASEDTPEPVVISMSGGQLTQALYPRVATSYASTEVVPKSTLDTSINTVRTLLLNYYANLNKREVFDDTRIRSLIASVANLTSVKASFIYSQASDSDSWVVAHGLDSAAPEVSIWIDNELVMADTVEVIDSNTLVVHFSSPVQGIVSVRA